MTEDFNASHPSIAAKARTLSKLNELTSAAFDEGIDLQEQEFVTTTAVQDHTIDLQTLHALILEHAECKTPHLLADDRKATCLDMVLEQTSYHPPNPAWLPAEKVRQAIKKRMIDYPGDEITNAMEGLLMELRL